MSTKQWDLTSSRRAERWCYCAALSPAMRLMPRRSSDLQNTQKKCSVPCGASRLHWKLTRKRRCRKPSCTWFAKGVGAEVNLASDDLAPEFVLFGEDASRILISCDPKNVERIKQIAVQFGLSAENIGTTVPENLVIRVDGKMAARAAVLELKKIWASALEEALHTETEEQIAVSN